MKALSNLQYQHYVRNRIDEIETKMKNNPSSTVLPIVRHFLFCDLLDYQLKHFNRKK